jgi:hypothetical protein
VELRAALACEIGVRVWSRATDWALDLLTVALAISYARLRVSSVYHGAFDGLIDLLWHAVAMLGGATRPESKAEIFTWRDRALCAETALYAVVDVQWLFRAACRAYFHLPADHETALASALILPTSAGLGGCRWQTAAHPIWKVRKKANIHYHVEDLYRGGGEIRRTDAMYCARTPKKVEDDELRYDYRAPPHRGTVTLDLITDEPAEAVMVRQYSARALEELRRAAEGDADLHAYITARANIGGKAQDTWRALGWGDARGHRVDRRFRRLCVSIRGNDDLRDIEYLPATRSASMASHTVYREILFGGQYGREKYAVYQHVLTRWK